MQTFEEWQKDYGLHSERDPEIAAQSAWNAAINSATMVYLTEHSQGRRVSHGMAQKIQQLKSE